MSVVLSSQFLLDGLGDEDGEDGKEGEDRPGVNGCCCTDVLVDASSFDSLSFPVSVAGMDGGCDVIASTAALSSPFSNDS